MRRAVGILTAVVLFMTAGAAFAQRAPEPDAAGVTAEPVEVMAPGLADELAAAPAGKDVLVFVHATTLGDAKLAATNAGLKVVDQWERINVAIALGTPDAVERVALDPKVSYVEPNRAVELYLDTAHDATGANDARSAAFGLLDAQGNAFDGTGVTIAINDSGVDGTHPMFNDDNGTKVVRNLRQLCHPILCDWWEDVFDSDIANGHGTHVAGIAAGYEDTMVNGEIVRGAAPDAKLVALGSGAGLNLYATASGLNWVLENHADPCGNGSCPPIKVVNNSWGVSGGGNFRPNDAAALLSNQLVAAGVTVVFSAGNGDATGDGGDGTTNRVNPYSQNPTPGVISVANYDDGGNGSRNNALDSSSSRGLKTDPTTYPDLAAPGANITSACTYLLPICRSSGDLLDPYYAAISGTSMAAPYVSGIVAVLLEADPTLTPAELEDILEDTAHKFGDPADFVADPRNADDTTAFDRGHGLIDVTQALARVLNRSVSPAPACGPGAGIIDASGDATDVAVPTGAPSAVSEDALDVVKAGVSTNPSTGALTFSIEVLDLGDLPPKGAVGEYFRYYFTYGGVAYMLGLQRLGGSAANSTSFSLTTAGLSATSDTVASGLPGSFDPVTDTISTTIPANVFNAWRAEHPVLTDGDLITGLQVLAQRRTNPLTLTADSAAGLCPYIVGT